jgi:hypothetical protein
MRLVSVLLVTALIVVYLCRPAIPGEVTVTQGGKSYKGWNSDRGKIAVTNPGGKIIMYGEISRLGGVELTSELNDDTYVGQVRPSGEGWLISPRTGDTLRIVVER